MEEFIWIIIIIGLVVALVNKDKELLSKMTNKKKKKAIKKREEIQNKNMKELWIFLGIIALISFLFIFFLMISYS